jgi:hypothetical protein
MLGIKRHNEEALIAGVAGSYLLAEAAPDESV